MMGGETCVEVGEACGVLGGVGRLVKEWNKHCSTIHSLADQLKGLKGCERDVMAVPAATVDRLEMNIQAKLMDELHCLATTLKGMEKQHDSLASTIERLEQRCQQLLTNGEANVPPQANVPLRSLQVLRSTSSLLAQLIAMKRIPLLDVDLSDLETLYEFKKVGNQTEAMEGELASVVREL